MPTGENSVTIPGRFRSILFHDSEADKASDVREQPDCFPDLNLDQIVASITAGRDEYNLKPFFYLPLATVEAVDYRHDVFRDLENPVLLGHVQSFAQKMREMRAHLSQSESLYYQYQKESWFLDAVAIYCRAVADLSHALAGAELRSEGFAAFQRYLTGYIESDESVSLATETRQLQDAMSGIKYSLHIQGKRITVARFDPQPDYGTEVLQAFEKFRQKEAEEYRFGFSSAADMNHVEAAILDLVARLYPDVFSMLDEFPKRHAGYLNTTIAAFDREVQFYIACLDHIERLKRSGLTFCYPAVNDRSREICAHGVFDLALAERLTRSNTRIVTNDFELKGPERIIVVSGPNQGGKTTFARTFGQLHYLAGIGCPVPAQSARLFLCDEIYTHFDKEEDIANLSSKLEDDLRRIHQILRSATARSILVMNESFVSTTLSDALLLSRHIMWEIMERDILCVSVTFLDELASLSEAMVSMVSEINPRDPAQRTFKVVRKPADGLAYAAAIAEKYHLTFAGVKKRISARANGAAAP